MMIGDDDPKIEPRTEWSLHQFIDTHIQGLKRSAYGLAAVASVIIIWRIRATTKFVKMSQIPTEFISKNYTLQGKVKKVTKTGALLVDHIPIMEVRLLSRKSYSGKDTQLLPISPAGVTVTNASLDWLEKTVNNRHIWFQLLQADQSSVECDVKMKKNFLQKISISEELIRQGLCTVRHFETLPTSETYIKFLEKLVMLEQKADRKGVGLWKAEKDSEKWWKRTGFSSIIKLKDKMKNVFSKKKS